VQNSALVRLLSKPKISEITPYVVGSPSTTGSSAKCMAFTALGRISGSMISYSIFSASFS